MRRADARRWRKEQAGRWRKEQLGRWRKEQARRWRKEQLGRWRKEQARRWRKEQLGRWRKEQARRWRKEQLGRWRKEQARRWRNEQARQWRKEQLRRSSLLLLGCCSAGMMAPSLWRGLVGIGLFALAHAAFSAAQHRSYMRLTEKEDESLPIDIVLQTLLAFAVTCYGIVHNEGEFKDVDAASELKNKTFDAFRNHPSFCVFNHRGRVLFRPSDTTNSSNQDALSSGTSLKLRKLESLRQNFYKL
ncbi:ER membrane protein complex subunit 5-like isoform X2 [Equus przewalskii]|uniref:ER membrane protein complex subunit 5-like isoform X2 n=1 Tax=Equus przewalskii TaxID=9798 RepID=A0ABM4MZP0_EQUPR